MKLKQIYVDNLFGIYKYELNLIDPQLSHVTIIDAPNGMGKTTILRLIQATLKGDILYLDSIPFTKFMLIFDDGQYVKVSKTDPYNTVIGNNLLKLRNYYAHMSVQDGGGTDKDDMGLENIRYEINGREYILSLQRDFVLMYVRRVRVYNKDDFENLTLADVMHGDDYNNEDLFAIDDLSSALNKLTTNFNIYFIKTNRLFIKNEEESIRNERFRRRSESRNDMVSAVDLYKGKIRDLIISVGKEFADKSEELDRTFPQRVLNIIFKKNKKSEIYSKEDIEKALAELEKNRSELSELGLITEAGDSLVKIPDQKSLTDDTRVFLSKYIEDNKIKLEIYKEISNKLKLLRNIVNERNIFSDKKLKFSADEGIEIISKNGRHIPVDKLSSGEKNNFVLFYELIFACGNHSLILVDEPEISLHVTWQRQFIDELNEICKLKELQGIVATHSPDIVGDNVDYMVDLEDLNNV